LIDSPGSSSATPIVTEPGSAALAKLRLTASPQRLGNLTEHQVASLLAAGVIDGLQAVAVDESHGERLTHSPGSSELMLELYRARARARARASQ